ncbi:MAG: hypothetical protein WCA35_14365 [Kovacikia sp.]
MQTARYDLTGKRAIKKGSTIRLHLKFKQRNGEPLDFTGASAAATIRKTPDSPVALDWICNFATDLTSGEIDLVLPSTATAPDLGSLETGRYFWDFLIVFANGDHWYPLEGEVDIRWRITQ